MFVILKKVTLTITLRLIDEMRKLIVICACYNKVIYLEEGVASSPFHPSKLCFGVRKTP